MRLRPLAIVTATAVLLAAPATARAQAGERAATAEDLFRQGLKLTKQGRLAEACPRFAESSRLEPAYGALMNLAACYEKTGRTASAWQAYVDAADLARDKNQRARAASARKRANQLEPHLVRLEVRLGASVEPRGLEITRNGKPFDVALLGNAVPVDPGNQVIVASRPGVEPWETSVTATEPGKTAVVELNGPIAPPEPAPAEKPPIPPPATAAIPPPHDTPPSPRPPVVVQEREAGGPGRGLRIAGITLAAGGAALVATGGVFAWLSKSISDDFTDVQMGERFDPAREHRARTYQTSAFVLWGVGAAAIAGGATAYILGRQRGDSAVSVIPAPLRGGAAAQVTWQW